MISYSGLIGLQKMYSQRQRRNNESKNADEFYKNIRKKGYISGISADCKIYRLEMWQDMKLLVVSTGMIRLL